MRTELKTVIGHTRSWKGSHGTQQLLPSLPVIPIEILPQLVHQGPGLSLLAVVGEKAQLHGLPGESLKTGDVAGLSGSERVVEDHPALDVGEGPQLLQDLRHVVLPRVQRKDEYK